MTIVKFVLLPLLLTTIIALFSMTGCASGGTTPPISTPTPGTSQGELSQQELEQIFSESIVNETNLNTYKFNMDMGMITNIIGPELGKMTVTTKSNGAANLTSHQMQMKMKMDISVEGLGYEGGSQSLAYDIYQMTDWVYMRMELSGMGEQWMKMPASDELNKRIDLVDQQLAPLESAIALKLLGYANVDGEECYAISVVPDMGKLTDWLSEQKGTTQDINWGNIPNLSDVFKKLEYTYYVTKDTKLAKKLIVDMQLELTPEQTGESKESYQKMIMNISVDMTLSDFNEPFSINLPDEAENAPVVSENMLL
jgi:hypothetical protein